MFIGKLIATTALLITAVPALASQSNVLVCSATVYNNKNGTIQDSSAFLLDPSGSSPLFHFKMGGLNSMVISLTEDQANIDSWSNVLTTTLADQKTKKYFFHPSGNLGAVFGNKNFFGTMTCAVKTSKLLFKSSHGEVLAMDVTNEYSPTYYLSNVLTQGGVWCFKTDEVQSAAKTLEHLLDYSISLNVTKTSVDSNGSIVMEYEKRECVAYENDSERGPSCSKTAVISNEKISFSACK